jgi:chemotaxis protein methyltransferase CheR
LKPEDFELMRSLLKDRSGLIVHPDKVYLLESRLTPVARANGLEGMEQLVSRIRLNRDEKLISEVTEAMTTNESFFFRDKTPFDILENSVLPVLRSARASTKRIRIWCAAASSGQEPYSIAMLIKEKPELWSGWNIEILATDIANNILEKAKGGVYSQFEVQRGLPVQLMIKYFEQQGDRWVLSPEIRNMVRYEKLNLLKDFNSIGTFDAVFCRNVLIYFDQPTKSQVMDRIRDVMKADGSLFLGAAETVLGVSKRFKPVKGQRGIYLPTEADAAVYGSAAAMA